MKATEPWCSIIAEQFGDKTQMYNLSVLHSSRSRAGTDMVTLLPRDPRPPAPLGMGGAHKPLQINEASLMGQVIAEPQTCGQSSLASCQPRFCCRCSSRDASTKGAQCPWLFTLVSLVGAITCWVWSNVQLHPAARLRILALGRSVAMEVGEEPAPPMAPGPAACL